MASKTQILLLLVAVMVANYGLTNATNSTASTTTINSTAASLSPAEIVGLPGLLIYTITSTVLLKLFQLI